MKTAFLAPLLLAAMALQAQPLPGFTRTGDPKAQGGATWTFQGTRDDVAYDLQGILFHPRTGNGPFGAVVVSHGKGGNAQNYSAGIARTMREWGLVVIATNYTHAVNVPLGAPGEATEEGAWSPNILRGRLCLDLLRSFPEVDPDRIAAHGHSMGAYVTAGLVGTTAGFRAASHTAGGVVPKDGFAATSVTQAQGITAPYQMHHGDSDRTVLLASDRRLDSILTALGVAHELLVYPGYGHNEIPLDTLMLGRVKTWYANHGVIGSTPTSIGSTPTPIPSLEADGRRYIFLNAGQRKGLDILGRRTDGLMAPHARSPVPLAQDHR